MQFGLIGEKLGHSYSKEIHEALGGYSYELCPMPREALDGFMRRAAFEGINVTIPYKQDVLPYLDEVDGRAARIGAVNTIVARGGRLVGYNTDYMGVEYMLRRHGVDLEGKTLLILGSGGTRATVQAVAADHGAKEILVAGRSGGAGLLTYGQAMERADVEIVFNCSPAGMYPNNGTALLDLTVFPKLCAVVDAVYNPFKTALLLQAEALGVPAVGGLEMLVAQAAEAWGLFTGGVPEEAKIDEIYRGIVQRRCNVSLVGMPGCGKTSLGKALAKAMGKAFVDLDAEIEKKAGMPIPQIFAERGEGEFRDTEAQVTAAFGAGTGQVLSTGGGVVKRRENVDALRQNGPVVFIDCPVERLSMSDGRPLAQNRADLEALYTERHALYEGAADVCMEYHPYFKENLERLQKAVEDALAGWPT